MKTFDFFKDKTVTLMGLGLLGRGVGDAAFLARQCKKVFVTDAKSKEELQKSVEALKEFRNIEFFLGGHDTKIFENVDFVVKGAGVRLDNPYIAHAKEKNVPVYMSTALFAHLAPLKVVGVTGTRGKTTTTCMIGDILKRAGKKVMMGGNLRGVSTLALLEEAENFDYAVLELDSWQLQGFDGFGISPSIGVFTTFYPDHMNYYDGDMALYRRDKAAIFRHQKEGDAFVTTPEVAELLKANGETDVLRSKMILAEPLSPSFVLNVPGRHNLINASLAKGAAKACGIGDGIIDEALRNFDAIEGRLQRVGQWQGRTFYNDSNATTQEATLAALASFPPQSIVLIFGGADKGLPIEGLIDSLSTNDIRAVLIKGTGTDRVLQKLPHVPVASTMQEAFKTAVDLSKMGDHVILSPAFASFGVFKNEYDRSDQYMQEVRNQEAQK